MGIIKSLKYKKERILKQKPLTWGYLYVWLSKKGKVKARRVHRIVAEAFVNNPNKYTIVNHKDEDKTNNHAENLEWCDMKYNLMYGTRLARTAKKRLKPVLQIDIKTHKTINSYDGIRIAAQKTHSNESHIGACCRGVRDTHNGYIWEFKS